MNKNFYITTPIFYPNGNLHIGHIYTSVMADIFKRVHDLQGYNTFLTTGADENSIKIKNKADGLGMTTKDFLNDQAQKSIQILNEFDISFDKYIRTSIDTNHKNAVYDIWAKLIKNDDIYRGVYNGLYCVGCESFKSEKDLIEGLCPDHNTSPEIINEENYFFKLSKYNKIIKDKIIKNEIYIYPEQRKNEILQVLDDGLQDISFSRPIKGQDNVILVPNDDKQGIYVWSDALVSYLSALNYSENDYKSNFWPANIHLIGKDILRFHAAIWPAMLLSAGLELPKTILVHSLLISGGKKMSKSLGNIIDPNEIANMIGHDSLRFILANDISMLSDSEINIDIIKSSHNAHLANGLGNLTSRLLRMCINYEVLNDINIINIKDNDIYYKNIENDIKDNVAILINNFDIQGYTKFIWKKFTELDKEIQDKEPFKLFKTDKEKAIEILKDMIIRFYIYVLYTQPIMPKISNTIIDLILNKQMPEKPLFIKLD